MIKLIKLFVFAHQNVSVCLAQFDDASSCATFCYSQSRNDCQILESLILKEVVNGLNVQDIITDFVNTKHKRLSLIYHIDNYIKIDLKL